MKIVTTIDYADSEDADTFCNYPRVFGYNLEDPEAQEAGGGQRSVGPVRRERAPIALPNNGLRLRIEDSRRVPSRPLASAAAFGQISV